MKKILVLITMVAMMSVLTGCGEIVNEVKDSFDFTQSDINTYTYSGDVQFIPISWQNIDDDTRNGLDITRYVDLETGVIYIYAEKNGYGSTWEVSVNPDGTPIIYADLEQLREINNYFGFGGRYLCLF